MVEKIRHTTAVLVHGFLGFLILGSMTLAAMWLKERLAPRQTLAIELSPEDILMQLAQSKNYEIKCDKDEVCQIALK